MSNDNPFSETQFRTVKYRPEFPGRFGSLAHARDVSRDLFAWYNDAHHHSGLSYLTPAAVHPPVPMIYETTSLLRLVSGRGGFNG